MSLKTFHIFFIIVSSVVCFGFSAWCLGVFGGHPNFGYIITGIFSFISGIGLIYYGVLFLKKFKHLPFY